MPESGEDQKDLEEQEPLGPEALARFIDEQVIADPSQVVTVDYPTRHLQVPQERVIPSSMEEIAGMEDASLQEPSWQSIINSPTRRAIACFDYVDPADPTGEHRTSVSAYKEFTTTDQGEPDGKYVRYIIRQCNQTGGIAQFSTYSWDMEGDKAVHPFLQEGISPPERKGELVQRFIDSGGLYAPTGGTVYEDNNAALKIEEVGLSMRNLVAARSSSPGMLEATTRLYTRPGRTVKGPRIVEQGPKMIDSGGPTGK